MSGPAALTVGVPAEVKNSEHRVAITPDGVRELHQHGVPVLVEADAGANSAITDKEYVAAGAEIVPAAAGVWERADLVCKVKEPQPDEFELMREGLVLFTYLHLAAYPEVAKALLARGVTGVAYETVQLDTGELPLLAPMSEVAGRMATQIGAHYLERENGGRGVLLGGAPGVRPGRVVVIGAGNVGWNSAWIAAGMEAEVVLLDKNIDRLRWVDQIHQGRIMTLASNRGAVERAVADADLVIGAVLVPGGRAPLVVTDDMVQGMKPRSVIVDVAIDQGGCVETIHETTHTDPVYEVHGVVHYAVGNIPGAVPYTSTYALTNATLPYLLELASRGLVDACHRDPALALGVNTMGGGVTHDTVAEALGMAHVPLEDARVKGGMILGGLVFVVCAAGMAVGAVVAEDTGARVTLTFLAIVFFPCAWLFFWIARKVDSFADVGELKATGLPANGTILQLRETGITINETDAVIGFTVMVEAAGRTPYTATFDQTVPRLAFGSLAPGAKVALRVDPDDSNEVAIDFDAGVTPAVGAVAGGAAGAIDVPPEQLQQMLAQFPGATVNLVAPKVGSAAEILATGMPGRATVINTFATDQTTPDGDPVVGYILNVQPTDGRPPYQVQLGHRTPRTLTHPPGPGANLAVKISPTDPEAVAIDWTASGL